MASNLANAWNYWQKMSAKDQERYKVMDPTGYKKLMDYNSSIGNGTAVSPSSYNQSTQTPKIDTSAFKATNPNSSIKQLNKIYETGNGKSYQIFSQNGKYGFESQGANGGMKWFNSITDAENEIAKYNNGVTRGWTPEERGIAGDGAQSNTNKNSMQSNQVNDFGSNVVKAVQLNPNKALDNYTPGTQGHPDILTEKNDAVQKALTEHANTISAKYDTLVQQLKSNNDELQKSYDNLKLSFDTKTQAMYDQLKQQEIEYRDQANKLTSDVNNYHDQYLKSLQSASAGEKARLSSNAQAQGYNANTALEAAQIADDKYGQHILSNQKNRLETLMNLQKDYQSFLQQNFANKNTLNQQEQQFASQLIDKLKLMKDEELNLKKEIRSSMYDPALEGTKASVTSTFNNKRYREASEERQATYASLSDINDRKQFLLDTLKSFYGIDISAIDEKVLNEAASRASFADAITYLANTDKRLQQELINKQTQAAQSSTPKRTVSTKTKRPSLSELGWY